MKQVTKRQSPPAFEKWKGKANATWTPTYENLHNPEKADLHRALLVEQGWVCCYCGRSVSESDSHVEHFRPQERRPELALSFDNLHASRIRERSPEMPLHCGHAKDSEFDEALHISPLELGCEQRFLYTLDGAVLATDSSDVRAPYMLGLLKLDIASLRNRRRHALQKTFDAEFLSSMSAEELGKLCNQGRTADADGRIQDFGHVVARFAEQRLAD